MLTIIATFLTYLANKADDHGRLALAARIDTLHWKLDEVPSRCQTLINISRYKFCTRLYRASQWFEEKGKYDAAIKTNELRWWIEGFEERPAWVPNIWKWYKRSRWLVLVAGPVLLLLLLVVSIYLTMIQMALAVVFDYLGPKGTLNTLWIVTSVFWCAVGFSVGRRFKV